jgi:hypothetical protein
MLDTSGRPPNAKPTAAMRLRERARVLGTRAAAVSHPAWAFVAGILRPIFANPLMRGARRLGRRLAAAGTAGYRPEVRRRLKILNVMCYLIATTTLLYAIQQATTDYALYASMVHLNLAIVAVVLLVPFAHRINDIAGGLLLVGVLLFALF